MRSGGITDFEAMYIHLTTDRAILVSSDGDRETAIWLPKSQVEWHKNDKDPDLWDLMVPEWMALEKGMI